MPKGSPELTAARRDEIMDACGHLYEAMNFRDVNLKEIGEITSFTRTSIYNYFHSKEEIFLALFEREYAEWTRDLEEILSSDISGADELAAKIAETLADRELMLKLLSANLYDIEENSRMERLVDFKRAYRSSADVLEDIVRKNFPGSGEREVRMTTLSLLEFLHGLYPYAHATEKQRMAMDEAGVRYGEFTLYELAYEGIRRILGR